MTTKRFDPPENLEPNDEETSSLPSVEEGVRTKSPARPVRFLFRLLFWGCLSLLLVIGLLLVLVQTDSGKEIVITQAKKLAEQSGQTFEVGELESNLPFSMKFGSLRVMDADGLWLDLQGFILKWNPWALLSGELFVDQLTLDQLTLVRAPKIKQGESPAPVETSPAPLPTSLPVAITLNRFAINKISIGKEVLGETAQFNLESSANLKDLEKGLFLKLALKRTDDSPAFLNADIGFNPVNQHLSLLVDAGEPKGGLLGKLIGLHEEEVISASIKGEGPLNEWKGLINVDAGKNLWVKGDTTIRPDTADTLTLQTNLKANVKTLLPETLHPLQGKEIVLSSSASRESSGAIQLNALKVTGNFGEASAKGKIDLPDSKVNLDYFLKVPPTKAITSLAQEAKWKTLTLDGNANGALQSPKVSAKVNITQPRFDAIALDSLKLFLTADPATRKNPSPAIWDVQAQVKAINPQGLEEKILNLIGQQPNINVKLTADTKKQEVQIHQAKVTLPAVNLNTQGRLNQWGQSVLLNSKVEVADLSRFNELTASKLSGSFLLTAASEISDSGGQIKSSIEAKTNRFSSGIAEVDKILKDDIRINGAVSRNPKGTLNISDLTVLAHPVTITADALLNPNQNLSANWTVSLPDMESIAQAINQPVSGRLKLVGQATGELDNMLVNAQLESPQIAFRDIKAKNLKLAVTGQDLTNQPNGSINFRGDVQGLLTQLDTSYRLIPQEAVRISGLDIALPGVELNGNLSHSLASGLTKGTLQGEIVELSTIANRFDQNVSGRVKIKTTLLDEKGQALKFSIDGSDLSIEQGETITLSKAGLTGQVNNILEAPELNSQVVLTGLEAGGGQIASLNGNAKGTLTDLSWSVKTAGHFMEPVKADLAGRWSQGETQGELSVSQLKASFGNTPVQIVKPLKLTLAQDETRISDLDMRISGGQVQADLALKSPSIKLNTKIKQLPLTLLDHVLPELKMKGQLNGDINFAGDPANPDGAVHLAFVDVHSLSVKDSERYMGAGMVDVKLKRDQATAQGSFQQPKIGDISFDGSVAIQQASDWAGLVSSSAPVQGKLKGDIDLASLNPFLAGTGNQVRGHLKLNGSAKGTAESPEITGAVNLEKGEIEIVRLGTHIKDMKLDLSANPELVTLKHFTGKTPGQGIIQAKGTLQKSGENDYVADFSLRMKQAILAAMDTLNAQVSSDLILKGPLSNNKLSGNIQIDQAVIRIPDKLPPNVVVVDVERKEKSGDSEESLSKDSDPSEQAIQTALDVKVHAPNQIYLKGRGLDAELQGDIHVTGTTHSPSANGKLKMRRGLWDILGKKLKFKRGVVDLDNAPKNDPEIDFETEINDPKWKIIFSLKGPATQPSISYRSIPEMPQDEILSRFLFNKDAGEISPLEAIQLASSAAELAGLMGSGPSITDKISSKLGLDSVGIGGDGDGGAQVEAGKYVTDKIFVGVTQGTKPGSTGAKVQVEVTPNLKVEGEMTGTSDSKLGLNWEIDY